MNQRAGRSWGYWTRAKLAILDDYLPAFLQASSGRSHEYVYLDAFAGEGRGVDRMTGEEFHGSSRIALKAKAPHSEARFTRLRYFEQANRARELRSKLGSEYPHRDVKVHGGDCNLEIPRALNDLRLLRWAPTFAFIDPDGMEFEWRTLEALADHKRGYRSASSAKREYKIELWLLFPTQGLVRTLALDAGKGAARGRSPGHRAVRDRRMACDLWVSISPLSKATPPTVMNRHGSRRLRMMGDQVSWPVPLRGPRSPGSDAPAAAGTSRSGRPRGRAGTARTTSRACCG